MGVWTWGNNFTLWGKNPWRTAAFNYEPWPFLLWFFPLLSCRNSHPHSTSPCNGQRLQLFFGPGVLLLCRREEQSRVLVLCTSCTSLPHQHTSELGSRSQGRELSDLWLPGSVAFSHSLPGKASPLHLLEYTHLCVLGWDSQGLSPCRCDNSSFMQEGMLALSLPAWNRTHPKQTLTRSVLCPPSTSLLHAATRWQRTLCSPQIKLIVFLMW